MDNKYPEHEKLSGVKEYSEKIGEFLEWLFCSGEQEIALCQYGKEEKSNGMYFGGWQRINKSTEQLLAEFFSIDLKKLEKEKLEMLNQLITQ